MAEPTIIFEANDGTEGTPIWQAVGTALRWVGSGASAGSLGVPHQAPVGDGDDVFFDDAAAPNDGELWNDTATDVKIAVAGRNTNQNVLRLRETGGADPTSAAPTLTAFDDATDAASRTDPTTTLLVGTAGTINISMIRAIETTAGAPGAGWTGQAHDAAPSAGSALDGDKSGERETCATALAASGTKLFNLAACLSDDVTAGLTSFVYAFLYAYE